MPQYDGHTLLLYLEKKLSAAKMEEISQTLKRDAVLLAHMMELSRVNALYEGPKAEISLALIKGEEKIFTKGAVNFLRRDKVQLRGLPRPMIHSFFETKHLRIGLTKTEEGYLLNAGSDQDLLLIIEGEGLQKSFALGEKECFMKLAPGSYRILCKEESIGLSLV